MSSEQYIEEIDSGDYIRATLVVPALEARVVVSKKLLTEPTTRGVKSAHC